MKRYLLKQSIIKQPAMSSLAKVLLVSFCMCLPLVSMRGQQQISLDVPRIVPVSPEATMMEKFQSYPVDLCTGVPDITIPLYEIDLGELTIPVTLSYHASGLKPKEQSGFAGTGWTLNLEPSISRQINGIPDEEDYGWFNRYESWNQVPVDAQAKYEYYTKKLDNTYDTYPDKFTYRLPHSGSSGYFENYYTPLCTAPRTNDKVIMGGSSYIDIYDENGIHYEFGGNYESTGNKITRWLCDGIYSARNGEQLASFSYYLQRYRNNPSECYNLNDRLIFVSRSDKDDKVIMINQNNGNYYELTANNEDETNPEPNREVILPSETDINYSTPSVYLEGDVYMSRLEEMQFMGNLLSVYYTSTGEDVYSRTVYDRIEVTNEDDDLLYQIRFYITPYNSGTSLNKLDSVCISAPGVEPRVYKFSYINSGNVPSSYTTNVDHWGFCKGGEGSEQQTIPNIVKSFNFDTNGLGVMEWQTVHFAGVDREPNPVATQYGVLYSVTNPEGIQTRFTYEGNAAAFRDNSKDAAHRDYLHPVGGLRVSQMEIYDLHTQKRIRKSYKYGLTKEGNRSYDPVWGGGAIKHLVTQRDYYSDMYVHAHDAYEFFTWQEHAESFSSMPVSDISFNGSVPVMYNIVEELVEGDSSDRSWYKNVYYYKVPVHDFEDLLEWNDSDPSGSVCEFLLSSITDENKSLVRPEPYRRTPSDDFGYGSTDQMYGALLRTDYYRDGILIESHENVYEKQHFWNYEREFTVPEQRLIISLDDYLEGHNTMDLWVNYTYIPDIYTFRMLDKEIVHRYLSDTVTVEKEYAYRYEFTDPGISLRPIRVATRLSGDIESTDHYEYLDGYPAILSYHRHVAAGDSTESRILFKENSCIPEKVQFRGGTAENFRDEVVYTCYDSYNNPTEIMGKNGVPVSFIWSYRNRFPIARIENASINEVYAAMNVENLDSTASASEPTGQLLEQLNGLRTILPQAQVTTYLYDPLKGVISITDPNGIASNYEYDGYARLTESSYIDEDLRKIILQKYVYRF